MAWYDFYKLFQFADRKDPIARLDNNDPPTSGITSPEVPDIRPGQMGADNNPLNITVDGSDFVDTGSVTGRINRYKEYDRLQNVAEIENALTTFADEACIAGDTPVITPFGNITIKQLAETKKPDEKFLVYCWDENKQDFTLGWAYHPRKVKTAPTVEILFDDGKKLTLTTDHLCLRSDGMWIEAGDIQEGEEYVAFVRIPANQRLTKAKTNQFPRIFTYTDGWKHERQFLDEWKSGKKVEKFATINTASKYISSGLNLKQTATAMKTWREVLHRQFKQHGFTYQEISWLSKRYNGKRRVVCVSPAETIDVYDLSVEKYKNFATDTIIVHNCQEDEEGFVFKIECQDEEVKKELNLVLHNILELDDKLWTDAKSLYKNGDLFWELVVHLDDPKQGIVKIARLPADSMFRIETIRGRLIEFQQSKQGPDWQSLTKIDPINASKSELEQATALRFHSNQIIHSRIGDERKTFYPYGVSVIEAARGPAHTLHLMEDSMVVYRLVRAPERRVFYVDVAQLSSAKAETYIERMKDQYRKKKVYNRRSPNAGSSAVEERFSPPSAEEDIWIPVRPNSQTKIDTLPGAQNLGEIDDAVYFRQKLYTALQFPRNYLSNNDPTQTRLTLSQQDTRFARMIERLQKPLSKAIKEIAIRHLRMRGWPEESFKDIKIKLTPPSDWRSINRNEVNDALYNRAATMKGTQMMSDFDILTRILDFADDEAREIVERNKAQKVDDLKLQLMASNPTLLFGGNTPEQQGTPVGTAPGGPNPQLGNPEGAPPEGQLSPDGGEQSQQNLQPGQQSSPQAVPHLPDPTPDELKRYGLEIRDAKQGFDDEEVDDNELGDGI